MLPRYGTLRENMLLGYGMFIELNQNVLEQAAQIKNFHGYIRKCFNTAQIWDFHGYIRNFLNRLPRY
ncbi:hypothetical protein DPMN_178317 [Dreissena polymorpha]|uniref:Uncharacterized protein n=1 Tax=Dreissena polymorpha TaxID=45954 RepID=A0A9D4IMH3_DREPO|nr:hypothetical protein DPMN_178317 [Dreissena polymorpha]